MDQLSIAICDGNERDMEILETHIRRSFPDEEITKFTQGQSLLNRVAENPNQFQIIFMETELPDDNGIRVAAEIRKLNKLTGIIFVTGTEKYYREAFDVFASQYLLKPVDEQKLKDLLEFLHINAREYSEFLHKERVICFKHRSQLYTIKHNEIQYLASSLHTVTFYLDDGSEIRYRGKLSDFEEQLKDSMFLRCHQSFFVNISKVIGMKTDGFIMKDFIVPISRTYMKEAQKQYRKYLGDNDSAEVTVHR